MGRDSLPGCWRDFVDALDAGIDRIVLYGPSGTGKTYAALREGVGVSGAHRLVCTEDMTAADVTGCWMPTAAGQFEWLGKFGAAGSAVTESHAALGRKPGFWRTNAGESAAIRTAASAPTTSTHQ